MRVKVVILVNYLMAAFFSFCDSELCDLIIIIRFVYVVAFLKLKYSIKMCNVFY